MKSAREAPKRGFYREVYPVARRIGITRKELYETYVMVSNPKFKPSDVL